MLGRIRERLSYANVMATAAVFIALGGTSYALTLPRNSVGSKELRPNSIGRSELRRNAVTSAGIKNRSVRLRDIARGTRDSLRGQAGPAGPPGVTFFAAVDAGGGLARGNANFTSGVGANGRIIGFPQPIANCVATATLASVPGGSPQDPPATGHVTVAPTSDGKALVRTWNANGSPVGLPFHLIVAC